MGDHNQETTEENWPYEREEMRYFFGCLAIVGIILAVVGLVVVAVGMPAWR